MRRSDARRRLDSRRYGLIVLGCVWAGTAWAQDPEPAGPVWTVSGKVVRFDNGEPIPDCPVAMTRLSATASLDAATPAIVHAETTTNAKGEFTIRVPVLKDPSADLVYLYTRATHWLNVVHPEATFYGRSPDRQDVAAAGAKPVSLLRPPAKIQFRMTGRPEVQHVELKMRDGAKLATDVYLPPGPGPFPAIVLRTPDGKNKYGDHEELIHGIAVVVQDARGRGESDGAPTPFLGDGSGALQDGFDTIEWAASQSWCNGRVATAGDGAMATTQYRTGPSHPPHLVAMWAEYGAFSLYHHGVYPGGRFLKGSTEEGLKAGSYPPEVLDLYRAHPTLDGFWESFDSRSSVAQWAAPAVHWGGWFDVHAAGTVDAFRTIREKGAKGARGKQYLVMGPWTHANHRERQQGELPLPENAVAPPAVDRIAWLRHHLRGKPTGADGWPAVTYYLVGAAGEEGAPGNEWRTAEAWPPPESEPIAFYLRPDKRMSRVPALGSAGPSRFVHDPNRPVATLGGRNVHMLAGPRDQRDLEKRGDVLVFSTPPLEDPVAIAGDVRAKLWFSCDAPDCDLAVRLCDTYPDGRSLLVAEGLLRAGFRDGFEKFKPCRQGEVYEATVDLGPLAVAFNKGHRIKVILAGSNYPRWERNAGTGKPWSADDYVSQAIAIHHEEGKASAVELPLLPLGK